LVSSDDGLRESIAGLVHIALFRLSHVGEIQPITALLFMSAAMDSAALRNVDDLNEFGTRKLASPPGGKIFRITGYPERIEPEFTGKRDQKPQGPSRVFVSTVSRMNAIAYVSSIELNMGTGAGTKIDVAKLFS
jgi:hypothetical protein